MIPLESFWLLGIFLAVLLVTVVPFGNHLAAVMEGRSRLVRWALPLEQRLLRLCGASPEQEMGWKTYALSILVFSVLGVVGVYAFERLQGLLPLNPKGFADLAPDLAMNTAISFITNTNWQAYAGESTMSHLTQMAALAVHNFLSAATGIAVAFALIRGVARRNASTVGNFWVDLYRVTIYVLLPISIVYALVLVSQGVIQNFSAAHVVSGLEGAQTLPMGPVASQEAIKMLGTNGGGFFNANSAHPFENPTPLTNFLQMLSIFLIPAALCQAFGKMVGDTRQGWAVLGAMTLLFVVMVAVIFHFEAQANPLITAHGIDPALGNLEGKETRFGIAQSSLFAAITTAASCGAVNAMHASLTPLGGLVPLWLIQLGEVVFGGVGSGLYGMLVFALLAVFIAGLMIGRTPEYLGKKIGTFEIQMASIVILLPTVCVLGGTAISVLLAAGRAGVLNPGPHGFSEILYAFSSAANNNGSAFAGLSANTPYYNAMLGGAMWAGRFGPMVAALAIAGSLASKKRIPAAEGTMPTHGLLFILLLAGTVFIVGALTYVPALALGPVAEHLLLQVGH